MNSGSRKNGRSACTTRSTQSPGMSTRGSAPGRTISSACTITTPSWKAAASAIVGVSSVFGPVYRLPCWSAGRRAQQRDVRAAGRRTSARTARRRCGSRRSTPCRPRPSARSARSAVPRTPGRASRRCPARTGRGARLRDTDPISMCRSCSRAGSQPARVRDRKSACFWLSPSSATRSPGRMTASSTCPSASGLISLPSVCGRAPARRSCLAIRRLSQTRAPAGVPAVINTRFPPPGPGTSGAAAGLAATIQ